ncbi:2-hydroxyacid dehydrogenase [Pseudaestuariivita atlantica]|uniref:2-hydroxyacid dehydrogenase n=1 Tax=Pseudaestuariivita atlantica TaxID=1317121 RepID=A0A0L1JV42_9RHOB|nr:2-hydroxyacid dehydrogenase [Pseudaestuariivita atlantica]KNG95636.1 2-hydroxyacid dehydrogenase [Pseudaestuariivita atlantica]
MPDLLVIGDITDAMRDRLAARFTLHHTDGMDDPEAWLDAHGAGIAHVATNGHDGVKPAYMDRLPDLKMISCYGVGYDAIDASGCAERGILVSHTPNVLNAEVASTTLMLMLMCYRNALADEAHARSGAWEREGNAPLSRSADNRRVGILGMGRIGQEIARKLEPFDATILYHSRSPKDVPYEYVSDLKEMAGKVDVLVCITPGGPETRHLVNAEVMEALGPDGLLINVSRGSVVDEAALIDALSTGKLGMAGLDVFEREPHIPDALKALPNVVLLPHVGSATVETRGAMGALVVDNLIHHLDTGGALTPVPECAHLVT